MTEVNQRKRSFTWEDPLKGVGEALHMTGEDYLKAMVDGKIPLPPLLHTLDFKVGDLEKEQ